MALALPRHFTAISGKIGSTEFATRKKHTVIKNPKKPKTKLTAAIIQAQRLLSLKNQIWRSLSPELQLAWASFAAHNPTKNRLGASTPLTPFQSFHKYFPYPVYDPLTRWARPPLYGITSFDLTIEFRLVRGVEPAIVFVCPKIGLESFNFFIYIASSYRPMPPSRIRAPKLASRDTALIEYNISWTKFDALYNYPQPGLNIALGVKSWELFHYPTKTVWATATVPPL